MGASPLGCVYKGNVLALKPETYPQNSLWTHSFHRSPVRRALPVRTLGLGLQAMEKSGPQAHGLAPLPPQLCGGLLQTALGLRPAKHPAPK